MNTTIIIFFALFLLFLLIWFGMKVEDLCDLQESSRVELDSLQERIRILENYNASLNCRMEDAVKTLQQLTVNEKE